MARIVTDWLKPFDDNYDARPKAAAPSPALPNVPERTLEEQAASRARMRGMVMQALGPYAPRPAAAAPDPEAPLFALLAAHEMAVHEAAAAAWENLAYRRGAWRLGRALDGNPIAASSLSP